MSKVYGLGLIAAETLNGILPASFAGENYSSGIVISPAMLVLSRGRISSFE